MALASLVVAFSLVISLSIQQQDPLQDFCRRFGHQTALIDNKYVLIFTVNGCTDVLRLFIDGGLVNFNPLPQNPLNYTSVYLVRFRLQRAYMVRYRPSVRGHQREQ